MTEATYNRRVERIVEAARSLDLPSEAVDAAIDELDEIFADEESEEFQARGEAAAHLNGAWG